MAILERTTDLRRFGFSRHAVLSVLLLAFISLFMISPGDCGAAIYYVDSTIGQDTNTGLSPTAPWKTIAKVNSSSFFPRDQILFNRGGVWREQLTVPSSGASGNVIAFGAYGSGNLPQILGSKQASAAGDWTQEDANLWYTAASPTPAAIWKNGSRMTKVTNKTDISTNAKNWWWDSANSRVYAYGGSNAPTFGGQTFEIAQRSYCITATDKGYITVDSITCLYANTDLIRLTHAASTLPHWTIQNCTLTGVQGKIVNTIGNAINQFDNFSFINNTATDWGGNSGIGVDGVCLQYGDAFDFHNNTLTFVNNAGNKYGGAIHIRNTSALNTGSKIYNNIINGENSGSLTVGVFFERVWHAEVYLNNITGAFGMGIWTDAIGTTGVWDGSFYCKFYRNCVALSGPNACRGIMIESTYADQVYYNVIDMRQATADGVWGIWVGVGNSSNGSGGDASSFIYNNTILAGAGAACLQLGWTGYQVYCKNMTVKNNIFYLSGNGGAALIVQKLESAENGHVFDYNCYYASATPAYLIGWFGSSYASSAALNASHATEDAHGLTTDPQFLDAAKRDCRLQSTSHCINAGIDVGLTLDYQGNSVATPPSIGAFELPKIPPPVNLRLVP